MIEVDRLTKRYGPVPAIQDVSFTVEKGQIVGFLGPNGAGKTTTMRILSCFMPASGGTARVAGYDVFEQSLEVRRRIGYLPENVPLYADMTVDAYLDFVANIKGLGAASAGAASGRCSSGARSPTCRTAHRPAVEGLSAARGPRPGAHRDPEVLILDEPTIGLDPKQIVGIRQLIKSLAGAHTVILSTHILPEVSMVCEGVIIINRGRVVASGPLDRLMQELSPTARLQVQVEGPAELVSPVPAGAPRHLSAWRPEASWTASARSSSRPIGRATSGGRSLQLVAQQRWGLLELKALDLSLEDVFIRIVAGEEHERGDDRRRGGIRRGGGVVRAWAIFKKELRVYFSSPIAYAVLTIFALISRLVLLQRLRLLRVASMQAAMNPMMARDMSVIEGVLRPLFQNMSVIMLLMMPILTMRLFSEEKKSGTIELLLTFPVRDGEVLLGKYLAALAVFAAMLAITLAYPLIMAWVTPLELGPLATGYLGLLLQGAAFIAIGILISSLTENQIVAAVATFGTLLIFWVIAWASDSAGGNLGRILSHVSLTEHFDSFSKGVIDTKDLIYYLDLTILALFLTLRSLDSKRWRG